VLDHEDPGTIDMLIKWIYTGVYLQPKTMDKPHIESSDKDDDSSTMISRMALADTKAHIDAYLAADRFLLEDLKSQIIESYESAIRFGISNSSPGTQLATLVFEKTQPQDGLRRVFTTQIAKRLMYKHSKPEAANSPLAQVLKTFEPMAWELCSTASDEIKSHEEKMTHAQYMMGFDDADLDQYMSHRT
jgi:hypothetical protein